MKKKILLTGGSGFVGRNVLNILSKYYDVIAPTRTELNIIDENNVEAYLNKNKFDILIHCANISPAKNPNDSSENMLDFTIRGFLNLEKFADNFEKILYIGSGAEYNKTFDIKMVKEESIGKSIPTDPYGYAKFILNKIARNSKNIYNLRIFGCYGPTDVKSKFIRDSIDCCLENRAITIRQNCLFDYMYVDDLANIMCWFIDNKPKHHDYNICSGKSIDLVSIAKVVNSKMGNDKEIIIPKDGMNKEYTASNSRLLEELKGFEFTSIEAGIEKQIVWQKEFNYEKAGR